MLSRKNERYCNTSTSKLVLRHFQICFVRALPLASCLMLPKLFFFMGRDPLTRSPGHGKFRWKRERENPKRGRAARRCTKCSLASSQARKKQETNTAPQDQQGRVDTDAPRRLTQRKLSRAIADNLFLPGTCLCQVWVRCRSEKHILCLICAA